MQKSVLLSAIQKEIQRHDLSYFVDEPPSVAQGGKGVVVSGCPTCKKRFNTMTQFVDHLTNDAMPALLDKLSGWKQKIKGSVPKLSPITGPKTTPEGPGDAECCQLSLS